MYLFINNLANKKTVIGVKIKKNISFLTTANAFNNNEKILLNINKILQKNNKKIESLKGVVVVNGPGSFSGIRVALAVANTLSWALNIPAIGVKLPLFLSSPSEDSLSVPRPIDLKRGIKQENINLFENGIKKLLKTKKNKQVLPFYGKKPNITKSKQK